MKYLVKSEIHAGTKVEPIVLEAGKVYPKADLAAILDVEALVEAGALAVVEEEKVEEEAPADEEVEAPSKKKGKK